MTMQFLGILFLIFAFATGFAVRRIVRDKKRRAKQLELSKAFNRLVFENKLSIEHSDVFAGCLLALDRKNKKLLFIDHRKTLRTEVCVSLASIAGAALVEQKDEAGAVDKIYLELKTKTQENFFRLCFFDKAYDKLVDLPSLYRSARHWKSRIEVNKNPGEISLEMEYLL